MRLYLILAAFLALSGSQSIAGKIPYPPERLTSNSSLIVVGTVNSYTVSDQTNPDGSIDRTVLMAIVVETVE